MKSVFQVTEGEDVNLQHFLFAQDARHNFPYHIFLEIYLQFHLKKCFSHSSRQLICKQTLAANKHNCSKVVFLQMFQEGELTHAVSGNFHRQLNNFNTTGTQIWLPN